MLAGLLFIVACGGVSETRLTRWTTFVEATNPLVGKTYDPRRRALVAFDVAESAAARARFLLLGEKHDNPDHHRLQAQMLRAFVSGHRGRAGVVFEMIDVDLQPAIDAYVASSTAKVDGLREVLEWDKRGWPAWALYRPIFEVILDAHLKIVAGGLTHDTIHRLVHDGVSALPAEIAARARFPSLPAALAASLDEEIRASHCGFLPEAMIAPMSFAQRVKDAWMASLMVAQPFGAVLIAGNGHTRSDRGVPFELASLAPDAKTVSVSFIEVNGLAAPAAYAVEQPADFLVFTPRVDNRDPCAKLAHASE